jgi:hypothetical protein
VTPGTGTGDGGTGSTSAGQGGPSPGLRPDPAGEPIARLRPGGRSRPTGTRVPARWLTRSQTPPPTATTTATGASAGAPGGARVYEDHHLPEPARRTAWEDLVDWVIWLHDRYELSVEHRLPDCWPHHPGLVEELAALKAWRAEIYTPPAPGTPEAAANGGQARAWHGELRNVLHAAATVYAPTCRAGHKTPPRRHTGNQQIRAEWIAAQPALLPRSGDPAPSQTGPGQRQGASSGAGSALVVSDQVMTRAVQRGHARALHPLLPGYVRFNGGWWAQHPDRTWIAVTDHATTEGLDQAARTLRPAEQTTTTPSATTSSPHNGTSSTDDR